MEEKKEISMETRLLLAFLLMGLVLFGTQYFYKPPAPAPAASTTKTTEPAKTVDAPKPIAAAEPVEHLPMPGQVQAAGEETVTVDTDLYHVVFSNRGAVVKSWILKAYKDHKEQPLDLVNQAALGKTPDPFSLSFKSDHAAAVNNGLYKIDRSQNGLALTFEYSDGRIDAKKLFTFVKDSYLVTVDTQVLENGVPLAHSIVWRGGFGDETVATAATDQHAVYYDLSASKLIENDAKKAKDGPISVTGRVSFAGIEDKYFAGVFLPRGPSSVEVTTYSDTVPGPDNKDVPQVGVAVGGEGANVFSFFVGPKDTDLLKKVDPKLEQLIDWGWFGLLAKPLFMVINWTAHDVVHNWGWAIILVTIVINLLLFPLRISSMKSAKKMQRLQPQIKAINEKYKNISLRDPKKAEQNAEIMELYKREGVNPMGGCFPMLIQFPFLYAIYKVLSVSVAMRGSHWLWVHDLSQPETLPIRLLPVLLIVTQFLTQKMTPQPGTDPSQQKMMLFMPLVLGYVFYYLSSGLVLYYLTSNLVGIALQWVMNRGSAPPPAVVEVKPAPKRKR